MQRKLKCKEVRAMKAASKRKEVNNKQELEKTKVDSVDSSNSENWNKNEK